MTRSSEQTKETGASPPEHSTVTLSMKEWEAWRKAAGLHIDPETAEVLWDYTQVVDPYGVCAEIPGECDCVWRAYFALSPEMSVWIWFGDLPEATRDALWRSTSRSWLSQLDWSLCSWSGGIWSRVLGRPPTCLKTNC